MKKLSIMLVILLMAMSILTSLPTSLSFANTSRVNVTHDQLNVRSGAGTNFAVIGSANSGNSFSYLGSSSDSAGATWYKIQFTSSAVGFIHSSYATLSTPATPTPAPTTGKLVVSALPYLNVREGAGTGYRVIGSVSNGAQVEYYSLSNGWYQIKYGSGTGYISADFARPVSQPAPPPTPAPTPTPTPTPSVTGKLSTTAGLGLNVRSQPNTSSLILGTLALGSEVEYYSQSNGWYEINYKGRRAYISATYAKVITAPAPAPKPTPTPTPTPTPSPSITGKVRTTAGLGLNVRALPNTSSKVLGSLPIGSVVEYYRLTNGWYEIKYLNQKAYISATFAEVLQPAPAPKPTPTPTPSPTPVVKGKISVTAGLGLNVRSQPNTSSTILGSLSVGAVVEYYSLANGWYQIKYNNKTGYVSATYVKEVKPAPTPEEDNRVVNSISHELFPVASKYKLAVPVIITARAGGPSPENIAYKFSLKSNATGQVIMTQDYSMNDALIWSPNVAGLYTVTIEAKNKIAQNTQATSSLVIEVENAQGTLHSYSIDFYGKTLDQAVLDQLSVNGRAVTDASGKWIQATREQVLNAMDPSNYVPFDYDKDRPDLGTLTVTHDALNVRPFAATSGTPLGTVNAGEKYQVLDIFNDWYQIDFKGKIGWVYGGFVKYSGSGNNELSYPLVETSGIPRQMYQFLDLRFYTGLTSNALNRILEGKGILEGQGLAFIDASKSANINEVYLVAHALLETGNGGSQLANGFWYNPDKDKILPYGSEGEAGYVKVYNMFGIGAVDSAPVGGGVRYAYKEGWTTPAKAIVGGAQWIGKSYINSSDRQQYTLYTMKWNMYDNSHQYATDIGWAAKQTTQMHNIYRQVDNYSFRFVLPQYRISDDFN